MATKTKRPTAITPTEDESEKMIGANPAAADLAQLAETALLQGLYRDAAASANRCLSLQSQATQHKHYSIQAPFRWHVLQVPMYCSILHDDGDDDDTAADAWERSAAVAWQCWYAAATASDKNSLSAASSATLLEPFWRLFTSPHSTGSPRPMRLELLVLVLQLCWANETDDNKQWILSLATEVLLQFQQKKGGEQCDALGVLLFTEWLPLQPISTTRATLARLINDQQRVHDTSTEEEHTSAVDVLLVFCTKSDDLPWVVRCRDLLVSKLHDTKKKQKQCCQLRLVSTMVQHEDGWGAADTGAVETQGILVPPSSSLWRRWSMVPRHILVRQVQQLYSYYSCTMSATSSAVAIRQSLPVALGTVVLLLWIGRRPVLRQTFATALTEIRDAIIPLQRRSG